MAFHRRFGVLLEKPDYEIIYLPSYLPPVLTYLEQGRKLCFDVKDTKDVTIVYYPPRLGDSQMTYDVSEAEQPDIYGRIAKSLSGKKRYGFFGPEKRVEFRRKPTA
jgi:hypothetical protein